jgi:heme exporter protein A
MTAAPHRPHAGLRQALDLRVENLCVDRGGRRVIANLSFSLKGGEALKLTGRNGVGKSTLLRALAGLLPVAAGRVTLQGAEAEEPALETHYLAHADALKAALTVEENLDFWARYLARAEHAERAFSLDAALAAVGLAHLRAVPVALLSAGQKRRVALAKLLVSWRPLWLLDEPLTALDARSRADFARLMQDHCARGGLIIAATHEPLGGLEARELALGEKAGPTTGAAAGAAA